MNISHDMLLAYLDRCLPPNQERLVSEALQRDPALQAAYTLLKQDQHQLRRLFKQIDRIQLPAKPLTQPPWWKLLLMRLPFGTYTTMVALGFIIMLLVVDLPFIHQHSHTSSSPEAPQAPFKPQDLWQRPWNNQALAAGEACPTLIPDWDAATYPIELNWHTPEPHTMLFRSYSQTPMYITQATWATTYYRGPFLLRGQQLDGPGRISFGRTQSLHLTETYYIAAQANRPNTESLVMSVQHPGCYALQLDGDGWSLALVFEARIGPSVHEYNHKSPRIPLK